MRVLAARMTAVGPGTRVPAGPRPCWSLTPPLSALARLQVSVSLAPFAAGRPMTDSCRGRLGSDGR